MTIVLITMVWILSGNYQQSLAQPTINDPNLKTEIFVDNLSSPTSMAFVGTSILILEKSGTVRLVSNGILQDEPVLAVNVQDDSERGLLGIAVMDNQVFLYFTEILADGSVKNRVYKYEWDGKNLIEQGLLLDLPGIPGPNHDGGKLLIDRPKDNNGPNLFAVIGDLNHNGVLQNFKNGGQPDDTGVIFRVNPQDGTAVKNNPFINEPSTSKYFAYGIRNSFGMAIDPISGTLWNTENGGQFDELNIVKEGFNSGWHVTMGPISLQGKDENDLHIFPGSHYSDPALSWPDPPALTATEFLNSTELGDNYTNNIFVGDFNFGNLYRFELNDQRDGLDLGQFGAGLSDKVVSNAEELSAITFGSGFRSITDIKTGPDGLIYILSFTDGAIYKISPS
jgi:aldose sugar dehydrogenase